MATVEGIAKSFDASALLLKLAFLLVKFYTVVEKLLRVSESKSSIFVHVRLQRLEIKGFKSFAQETVINFNESVIGVVGPNGAGKSNLVDAVRWVLGEQKGKELRLAKMSDVIFNGTKKRKAGGVAYVSLTFENTKNLLPTEYNTVSISRYLYRSGESEYRLNNVPCRLKDIRSLFLDTGIGSNSYAIIALGMVEDILSDKENARRRMFEQAAGISKYKARKKETINKLNNTQADLDRVEDLLYEIEQNLKALEKQAKRTQKYFNLKERYQQLSIQLAVLKVKDLKLKYQKLRSQIEQEGDIIRQIEIEIREAEAQLEQIKQEHLDKEKSLSDFQKSMNELINNIRTAENDKKILEQKLEFLDQSRVTLTNRINLNEERLEELSQTSSKQSTELEGINRIEVDLEKQLAEAKDQLNQIELGHGDTKKTLDIIMQDHQAKQEQMVNLEKQLAIIESNRTSADHEIQQINEQVKGRSSEYSDVSESLATVRNKIQQQTDIVKVIEDREFRRLQQRAELEKKEDQLGKSLIDLNRQYDARKHEYDLIKNLVDKLEGFPDSIKFLNKSNHWAKPAPLLSDLIYCSETYRVIIENYLEPFLNHYVVETLDQAAEAVRLLSDAQKGRANFFILDAFSGESAEPLDEVEFQRAIDVVEIDQKYAPVVRYLLANVYIADHEDVTVIDDLPPGVILISPNGKMIRRERSLGGGSVGLFEGKKLGRKKYLKKLEEILDQLQKKIDAKNEQLDGINDQLSSLDNSENVEDLEAEKQRLEELKRQEVYLHSRIEHLESLETEAGGSKDRLKHKLSILDSERLELQREIKKLADHLENERKNLASADDSFNEIATKLADQNALVNQKNIELIRHQGIKESIEREINFNTNQQADVAAQLEADRQQLTENEEEKKSNKDKITALEEVLRTDYEVRKSKEGDLNSLEQAYYQARGEITDIENTIRSLHRKQQDQQQLINDLKDRFSEVKFKMSNVGERLKIEFDLELEEILNQTEAEDADLDELDQKVDRMRHRINNYGEINPMAVEAYNEMNERYESITAQRDDIVEARDSLLETIKEIEETATERFMEAFTQVRLNFIEVFRSLFTEDDNCDLVLLNEEEPLNSPIEIIAKPKGKRPKTLSQLSGGEKTLTAIALLFGLYLLKPAPFCIFDEVDAPLDDSNIEKFNRIINRFSDQSQFIIVTHNKLTMAAVDLIYGVYMEEQGVSNVSPVDFRSFSHTSLLEVTT